MSVEASRTGLQLASYLQVCQVFVLRSEPPARLTTTCMRTLQRVVCASSSERVPPVRVCLSGNVLEPLAILGLPMHLTAWRTVAESNQLGKGASDAERNSHGQASGKVKKRKRNPNPVDGDVQPKPPTHSSTIEQDSSENSRKTKKHNHNKKKEQI